MPSLIQSEQEDIVIPLRTLLFVPGNQERRLDKARSIPADALILDLEDSVPLAEKNSARVMVSSSIDGLTLSGREVFVRINALSTDHTAADIKAIVIPGLSGICLPKSESADDILKADALITDAEREAKLKMGSIRLLALVETPKGIINAYEIAGASPRVFGIAFGPEDYALEMDIKRTKEGAEIYYPRVVIAVACHAAGILAIDGVYTDIRDEEGLRQEAGLARQMGFHGKLLIHPNQVSPVSQIFSPTEEEIAHARGVVEAFEAALAKGQASTSFEGRMIDAPVAERARKLLALAESIAKQERTD
jgi:citrate lyase subunit beta/citryl-CoA lyase